MARASEPLPALHIGCGAEVIEGWVNIDRDAHAGVDIVCDVRHGLDFADRSVGAIFAEHFLEHLSVGDALDFLQEAHRVLAPGSWMRLSTPNLDWVWLTHYGLDGSANEQALRALHTNRAFYGWGHRFLWNRALLEDALRACGLAGIRWCRYGVSERPEFRGIERHERYEDTEATSHVLIAEVTPGEPDGVRLRRLRKRLKSEFESHVEHGDR